MAVIFIHSAMPAAMSSFESSFFERALASFLHTEPEAVTFAVRKAAHFSEYLVFAIFLALTVKKALMEKKKTSGRPAFFALVGWLIGTGYAVTDEFHQYFVPGRSCQLRDMCIDSAGVLSGVLLVLFVGRAVCKMKGLDGTRGE